MFHQPVSLMNRLKQILSTVFSYLNALSQRMALTVTEHRAIDFEGAALKISSESRRIWRPVHRSSQTDIYGNSYGTVKITEDVDCAREREREGEGEGWGSAFGYLDLKNKVNKPKFGHKSL